MLDLYYFAQLAVLDVTEILVLTNEAQAEKWLTFVRISYTKYATHNQR